MGNALKSHGAVLAVEFRNVGPVCCGDTLEAVCYLEVSKTISADFLEVVFHGEEKAKIKILTTGKYIHEKDIFSQTNHVLMKFNGGTITPGRCKC